MNVTLLKTNELGSIYPLLGSSHFLKQLESLLINLLVSSGIYKPMK